MKKLNYFLLGAAGLMLASCSQEAGSPELNKDGDLVTFTVKLPEYMATKAATGAADGITSFGSGLYARTLTVAAYDNGTLANQGTFSFPAGSNTLNEVSLHLAKGKEYQVVFFAQAPGTDNVYSLDLEKGLMSVNYANMTSAGDLGDLYDCFYQSVTCTPYNDNMTSTTVTLNRIVAQINWGADDLVNENGENNSASHELSYGENGKYINSLLETKAYTQFDLLNGNVVEGSDTAEVKLGEFGSPWNLSFPGNTTGMTYAYVAMQYVLAPVGDKTATYDLSLTLNNGGNTNANVASVNKLVEVSNVPVQANYQTNIYGTLFTMDAQVSVTIIPGFAGEFGEEDIDGIVSEVVPDVDND